MSQLVAGQLQTLSPLVRRIVAPNAGLMTGPGTNTYVVGIEQLAVIDPGPPDPMHIQSIRQQVNGKISWVLATHTHRDHSPGASMLARETGAELLGMPPPPTPENDQEFSPDRRLRHDDVLGSDEFTLRAVHTPGHASNHLCYVLEEERTVFTGDHIMNGSTVVIVPPDGNMLAYLDALAMLKTLPLDTIAPGHGDLLQSPNVVIDWIIAHRLTREQKVVDNLRVGPATIDELLLRVYDEVDPRLHSIAKYSLLAHLIKLEQEQRALRDDKVWQLSGMHR